MGFGDLVISKADNYSLAEKSADYGLVRRLPRPVPLSPETCQDRGSEILLRNGLKGLKLNQAEDVEQKGVAMLHYLSLRAITPRFYLALTCFSMPLDGKTLYQFKLKFSPQFL